MVIYFKQLCAYCNVKPIPDTTAAQRDGKMSLSFEEERFSYLVFVLLGWGKGKAQNRKYLENIFWAQTAEYL